MAAAMTLVVFAAGGASASEVGVRERAVQHVTYEVAPQETVTREISDYWVVVKEISPYELIRKARAEREARAQKRKVALESMGSEITDLGAFLDRLMLAESSGRDSAANPLSSALGPFQFIKSTFLEVARRHFPADYAGLTDEQVLALRTNREVARAAAAAYTMENAAYLKAEGHEPTWPHLRLAFLLGPAGASRVLQAQPNTPLSQVLSASVLQANPFMNKLTATGLVARAARDVGMDAQISTGSVEPAALPRPEAQVRPPPRVRPGTPAVTKGGNGAVAAVKVRCNQKLVSCKRWIAMQKNKKTRNAQGDTGKGRKG